MVDVSATLLRVGLASAGSCAVRLLGPWVLRRCSLAQLAQLAGAVVGSGRFLYHVFKLDKARLRTEPSSLSTRSSPYPPSHTAKTNKQALNLQATKDTRHLPLLAQLLEASPAPARAVTPVNIGTSAGSGTAFLTGGTGTSESSGPLRQDAKRIRTADPFLEATSDPWQAYQLTRAGSEATRTTPPL